MIVTLLDHSGFLVQMKETVLAFDYSNPKGDTGVLTAQMLADYSQSYLLFSHSHGDHVCAQGLTLPASQVFRADDFPSYTVGMQMRPGECVKHQELTVRTFGSTDVGVSFLVEVEGKRIFHAGDLNLWHWELESTAQEITQAEQAFFAVMDTLTPFADTLDLAFFPLDARMGKNTARGIEHFRDTMHPRALVPMHAFGDERIYLDYAVGRDEVIALTARGMTRYI